MCSRVLGERVTDGVYGFTINAPHIKCGIDPARYRRCNNTPRPPKVQTRGTCQLRQRICAQMCQS